MGKTILYIFIIVPGIFFGQLTFINPGFEGVPTGTGQGETPAPWQNCMPFGFFVNPYGEYATPDMQPNLNNPIYEIILPASEGEKYIGFGHITPYFDIPGINEFQEGFSQELSNPMIANSCPYIFTIDLANGLTPDPWNTTGIQTTIGEVKVFGGFDVCSEEELLWESGPITNENWETYTVEFTPSNNYTHILFECFKSDPNAACGYVLADNITPITNAPPVSNAGENQTICENFTNLNANNVENNETGTWSVGSGDAIFDDINNPNSLITNLADGDNIFEWTVSSLCTDEIGVNQVIITFVAEPNPNAGDNQEVCDNFTNLNANNPETNETGLWTVISGSGVFDDTTNPNTLITNLSEGENILQWTLSSDLCGNLSDQVIIDISTEPIPNAGNDLELCENFASLNANNPEINETGLWTIISGSGVFDDPTDPNAIITGLSEGENILQWSLSSDLCGNFSDQVIIDSSTEPVPNAGDDLELCENFANLNANNPEINETGLWTIISGSGSFNDPTDPNTLVTDLSEGENILQWSLSSDLCGVFSSQTNLNYINSNITVNAGQNLQICEDNIYLNGNTPSEIESGYWSIISGSGTFEDINNPTTFVENLSIGNNVFAWTIYDLCESLTSEVTITYESMNVSVDNISNYTEYQISCYGENDGSIDIFTIGGYPPYNYSWTGPNNFTSNSEDISGLLYGDYECIITDNLMCEEILYITLEQPPAIELEILSFDDLDCFNNGHVEYIVNGGAGELTGEITTSWSEVTNFNWSENNTFYASYEDFDLWDGLIGLTTTDQNGCTESLEDIYVQTWDEPIAQFSISTYNAMTLELIEFNDESYSESNIVSWIWDFGDGYLDNSQTPSTSHYYENSGQYTICLNIEDENGCISETCQIININTNHRIYIPNTFTVNNDGINDIFKPVIQGIEEKSYNLAIYDRWGKQIFFTNNTKKGWDGTYKGKIVTQDIYSYTINYTTTSGYEQEHIGKVTLLK